MRYRRWLHSVLALALLAWTISPALASTDTVIDLGGPGGPLGALYAQPMGINAQGQIVGYYVTGDSVHHGFLRDHDGITVIDNGPTGFTIPTGINGLGQVVGYYGHESGMIRGFRWDQGTFIDIVVDFAEFTRANGINDLGQIVGQYVAGGVEHGFLWNNGIITTRDVPEAGASATAIRGINAQGQLVGVYTDSGGVRRGFLLEQDTLTTFTGPGGSSDYTIATGINDLAQVVGFYSVGYPGGGVTIHGFFWEAGSLTPIDDVNGAVFTIINGINNVGQVVGNFDTDGVPDGNNYGFVRDVRDEYRATIQPPINMDGSSVFNASRGVVPVKFSLTVNGASTCQLLPATLSLSRTAGGVIGAVNEVDYIQPSDNGSNFRISGCHYVYNLGARSLGVGTYVAQIRVGDAVAGTATFQLK